MKIAFLFAGQGAQYPGMGKDLYETSPAAKKIFDEAGEDIKRLCFFGSQEELNRTENTQPCVYTMTMAAYAALSEKGVTPSYMAGFSLGEYAALTASGVFSFADGLELVKQRGAWMTEAGSGKGGMAASVGDNEMTEAVVASLQKDFRIWCVNFNCPGQIVVAGEHAALEAFAAAAKEKGLRSIPLSVSGPFHSAFMEPVVPKLKGALEKIPLAPPKIPVISNVTARPLSFDTLLDLVPRQAASPVKWQDTVLYLKEQGVDTVIEIGPGKTLSGLCRKIDKSLSIFRAENAETLETCIGEL